MHSYNLIARHILAPGYDLLRGTHTMRCLAELERSQWWSPERIAALQSERLARLIEHAYRTVPHYRSAMQQRGITPNDIRSATDLCALPIISRSYVQQHGEEMRSEVYPPHLLRRTRTSGSTGTPLEFYGTVEDQVNRGFARGIRALEYTGLHLGDRTASLGRPRQGHTRRERILRKLATRFRRHTGISVDRLSDDQLAGIVEELTDARLDGIGGYPNAVALIAGVILDTKTRAPNVRAVVTGGAELLGHERRLIRDAFGTEPCSNYAAYEAFAIACECEAHEGLHIAAEDLIVEIVDEFGRPVPDSVEGRIVLTNLHNFGMPFIRYDVGDCGTLLKGSCACGRGLPRLGTLIGRKNRYLVTRSGRRVFPGTLFLDRLAGLGMRQYQIVQEDVDSVTMNLVAKPGTNSAAQFAALEERVRELFEQGLGTEMALRIEFVDSIKSTSAGKHVFMLSMLDPDLKQRQSR
jgi:phenylacetate-CoA ligase